MDFHFTGHPEAVDSVRAAARTERPLRRRRWWPSWEEQGDRHQSTELAAQGPRTPEE